MGSASKTVEEFAASQRGRDDAVAFGADSLSGRRNELPGAQVGDELGPVRATVTRAGAA